MLIRATWPACEILDLPAPVDAFWVECSLQEALHLTPNLAGEHQRQREYHPDWALCFLVSRDGQHLQSHNFTLPFSAGFNSDPPFVALTPQTITSLTELQAIPILPVPWTFPRELEI